MMFFSNHSSLLNGLNNEQLTAVTYPPQSALVLAGAGSGKTRVLTTRIAWLLQTQQASVHSILAVTFTNKAAKEMQTRLSAMTPMNIKAMWLGTFHGLCHRFLRLHHQEAQLPSAFQILDSSDQLSLIKRLLKKMNIAEEVLNARAAQHFINTQKESGYRAHHLQSNNLFEQKLIECYALYDETCQHEGVVDFAELMLRSYELLQEKPLLREHYQNRFNHILIDEFQDTNKLQYAWLKLMAGKQTAIFAVGDDDQSIYRFRGANVGNMTALMSEFAIESPIKLEQNYRSVGNILLAANAVIEHNAERLGKELRTDAEQGEKIRFFAAPSDFEEAQFVTEESQALHREGLAYQEMAVLYRSNAQSRVIEQSLFRAGIPYKIYGGLRFYERQEIKHALAYLRLAVNPDDDNALLRVINVPTRGIGVRTVEQVQTAAAEQGVSLWQTVKQLAVKSGKLAAFVRLVEQLQQQVAVLSLQDLVEAVVHESGLMNFYQTQKGDHQDRVDNLNELIRAAEDFRPENSVFENVMSAEDAHHPAFAVLAFLSNAALESGEQQANEGEDAVQLMTVHAAKGLEFQAVFLTGMEEGRFPSEMSLKEHGGLEEERRLMYVAITRARKYLYISMAQQRMLHGQTQFGVVSRFVDEIPDELMRTLSSTTPKYISSQQKTFYSFEPSNAERESNSFAGYRIGQNVRHAKFGTGVIIDAVDKDESARLTINFGKQGIKDLDTQFAKLEVIA